MISAGQIQAWFIVLAVSLAAQAQTDQPASQPSGLEAKTLVTVHLKNSPAEIAAAEISKASGMNITAVGTALWQAASNVTIDADNQPFWVVMLDFLRQSGMIVEPVNTDDHTRIQLYANGQGQPALPENIRGGMVIVPVSAYLTQNLDYTRPQQSSDSFMIRLRTYIDPQISMMSFNSRLDVTEAVDDKGNSLVPTAAQQTAAQATGQTITLASGERVVLTTNSTTSSVTTFAELQAPLKFILGHGKVLKSLKGTAHFNIVTKEDVWQIPELADAAGAERPFPGGKYTIVSLGPYQPAVSPAAAAAAAAQGAAPPTAPANIYALKIRIEGDAPGNARGRGGPVVDANAIRRNLHITDGLGRDVSFAGTSGSSGSGSEREVSLMFRLAGPANDISSLPTKLEWHIPVEISDIPVSIDFSDLALP